MMSDIEQDNTTPSSVADYILVALDASAHSEAALAAAVELAAAMQMELRGLFVEDINLLHLCGLPFGLEIGSFTAKAQRLERVNVEREFRVQAAHLRKIMADVAGQRRINWSFEVVRGAVTAQVLAAATSATMVSIGRVGRSPVKAIGSTVRAVMQHTQQPVVIQTANRRLGGPYTIVYTGSAAARNALALAANLASHEATALGIWLADDVVALDDNALQTIAQPEYSVHRVHERLALAAELSQIANGTVVLPLEVAHLFESIRVTTIVVP
ncbi:MAG: universal stress protein [Anaerolineales bacterium]|nr:universal stress protein [Anaerolineales bacterium]